MEFYKETRFKKSEIGDVPEDWDVVRLGDCLTLIRNGLTYRQNKEGNGYPVTRIETISEEKIDPTKVGFVNNLKIEEIKEYRLIEGDILFSHINSLEHIGKTAIYEGIPELLLHGMNLLLLRPNKSKVEPYYLLYLLKLYRNKKIFKNMAKKAVNQASINQTELKRIIIPLPPLEEQKAIAEILSKTDEAIQKVDEGIEKFEKLKKGLMNILINGKVRIKVENGKIYFYKETRFKNSEIGEVPEDWEVVRLGDEGYFKIIMGQSPPSSTYNENKNGLPFLQGCAEFGEIYPKPQLYTSKPLKIAEDGDLLISVRAPVGEINITPFKLCIGRGLAAIRPNNEKVNKFFIFYYLKMIRSKLEQLGKGSTFKAITKNDLENLKISLPPLEEQKAIAEILSKIDKVIQLKKEKKEKLQKIKKYFMDNLLTGKVRIKL